MTGPYGEAANSLYACGWHGVLKMPVRKKYPPPTGTTGVGGGWSSGADVWATAEEHPECNVAIRLPPNVIGFDVDDYGDKAGAATWAGLLDRFGDPGPTWLITSRTIGISGIRLFRVPPGLHWPGELGPGIELLQTKHRYAMAPPSIHPEGRTYRWVRPDGTTSITPPTPEDVPLLAARWVDGLTGGRLAVDVAKALPGEVDAYAWFTAAGNTAPECGQVRTTVANAVQALRDAAASRHDVGKSAVMALLYQSTEGHRGVVAAVDRVRLAWRSAVIADRGPAAADGEWQRQMHGALSVLSGDGLLGPCDLPDPCAYPLAGILDDEPPAPAAAFTFDDGAGQYVPALPDPGEVEAGERAAVAAAVAREVAAIRVRRAAKALVDAEDAVKNWRVPPILDSLTDELDLPDDDVEYRVAEVFPVGANVVLTAAFKAGKTSMVNHLVRCLVDDLPFLGRYAVNGGGGRVAVWNYEVSAGQYRRWLRALGIRNTGLVTVANLRGYTMPIISGYVQDWAVAWLTRHEITTWVVDPFARAFLGNGQSENDNAEVGLFLETLDVIKERAGISELIIPTHTGRAAMDSGAERSRGATRLDDWADVRWILTKDTDNVRYFRASGRDVETEEGTLTYDVLTRNLVLEDGGRDVAEPAGGEAPLLEAVLAAVESAPGIGLAGVRTYARHKGVKARNDRIDSAVAKLAGQGLIDIRPAASGYQKGHFPAPKPVGN